MYHMMLLNWIFTLEGHYLFAVIQRQPSGGIFKNSFWKTNVVKFAFSKIVEAAIGDVVV